MTTTDFPGDSSTRTIKYTIDPEYYDDLVAENSLAAYDFENASYCTTVVKSAIAIGDTGWTFARYYSTTYFFSFVYNTTTKEVVRQSDSTNYWTLEGVAAAFASGGTENFFREIGISRSSDYASSTATTVTTGWTPYYDAIAQELDNLTSQPGWQDDTAISTRVSEIRGILSAASTNLPNASLGSLLEEFDSARLDAQYQNEFRYSQLVESVGGDPDPSVVMSYPDLAAHLRSEYYTTLSDSFENLEIEQRELDQEIVDEWIDVWNEIDNRLNEIGDQSRSDASDTISLRATEAQQALVSRGIYNTNVSTAVTAWSAKAEASELRRINETLGQKAIELYHSVLSAKLQTKGQLSQTQVALSLQTRNWQSEMSRRLAELYQLGPGIVERRTDVAPGLNDIANLTMNIGMGQGNQKLLSAFQAPTFVSQQTTEGVSGILSMLQSISSAGNEG